MAQRSRIVLATLILLLTFVTPAPARAQVGADGEPPQVTLTVSIIREAGKEPRLVRAHQLLLRGDGAKSELRSGQRVPVPTASSEEAGGKVVASYSYQNVGLTLVATARMNRNGAMVSGEIDDSSILSREPLVTRTLTQAFDAYAPFGKPVRIAVVADPDGGTTALEIQVDRVK